MLNNLLFSNEVLVLLRERKFQPYAQLDAALQDQLADGVRFVPLRQGERLNVLDGAQLSVLAGKVRLSSSGRTLHEESTRKTPFMVAARGDILQALEEAVLVIADRDFLDMITSWHELVRYAKEIGDTAALRMQHMQRAISFRRLPLECAVSAMQCMQVRRVLAGAEIVRQGMSSESFFVLLSGRAEMWRQDFNAQKPQCVAQLRAGDSFGEESLNAGGTVAASVRMSSEGELLELPRATFLELLAKPHIEEVNSVSAKQRLENSWIALDVRHAEEFESGHFPQSLSLPLEDLRAQCGVVLSRARRYVAVCNSGKRSAVAALMLAERGYQVVSLKHGLRQANFRMVLRDADTQDKAVA